MGSTRQPGKSDAGKRITYLVELAVQEASQDPEMSKNAIILAKKLAQKNQISSRTIKHSSCENCQIGLRPENSRTRIRGARRVITCLGCGEIKRI